MRRSKILDAARSGRPVRITGLGHYIPHFIRYAAKCGIDGIWLDLEHRAMDQREIQALLAYSPHFDVDILLRPPTIEKTRLYRYLEDGAAGLMIPHVSTAERARELVQAVKFPPLGDRGLDAAGLDSDFMLDTPLDYEAFAEIDAMIGHGGIVVSDDTVDMAAQARFAMEFCAIESCGKCTPCRIGSVRGVEVIDRIVANQNRDENLELLEELCDTMVDGSLCAMGGMTPFPVRSAIKYFPEDFTHPPKS